MGNTCLKSSRNKRKIVTSSIIDGLLLNELKDFEYTIRWLISQKWMDHRKLGVFGASFEGFAVLSCASRLPQHNWNVVVSRYV